MGMSFIGSYSGIDQNTIDQLMEAERIPLKKLAIRQDNIKEKKDAWKDVNTRLNNLFDKMKALESRSAFNTKISKSSNENFVTIDAGNSAAEGRYDIHVKQLATSSGVIGGQIKNALTAEGKQVELGINGSFKITNGDGAGEGNEDKAISIDIEIVGTDTLKDIVGKINNATKDSGEIKGTGISATIVDNRIVLKDEKTGNRAITLEGLESPVNPELPDGDKVKFDLNSIGLGIGNGQVEAADFSKTGQSAVFTLNGIEITRDSNRITDAIEGMAINLNRAHPEGLTNIDSVNITSDTEKAAKLMQDFVDQYNSTMTFIEEKTKAGDPKIPGSKGSLAGESSLIRLQSSLRRAVTGEVSSDRDSINVASKIGVSTTDRFGKLTFDKTVFLEALEDDKEGVMNFLSPSDKDARGLISEVNSLIDGFISKENGVIKSQDESFERTLKTLASQIESFEERMERKEAYYVKTFTALDVAMMKAEDQMGWLIGQVESMNAGRR